MFQPNFDQKLKYGQSDNILDWSKLLSLESLAVRDILVSFETAKNQIIYTCLRTVH